MEKKLISRLYPTTKLTFMLVMIVLSFVYNWKFAYFITVPICTLLSIVDRKVVSYLIKAILATALFVGFIFLFKVLIDTSDTKILFELGFIKITEGAVIAALQQTRGLVAIVFTVILFFETTDMEEFMISLQKLNASHVVTYVVLATLQLIPDMAKKSSVIMEAQQARGIETQGSLIKRVKAFFPSLGPLIISSITDIEDKSITLEVRGFSSESKKTSLIVLEKRLVDKIISTFLLVLLIVLIVGRYFIWQ